MRNPRIIRIVAVTVAIVAAAAIFVRFRPDQAVRVFTAFVAHEICVKTFVSGFDPDETFRTDLRHPGVNRISRLMRYSLNRSSSTVETSVLGLLKGRALYRPGMGCVVLIDTEKPVLDVPAIPAARVPEAASASPRNERLTAAVARAFEGPTALAGTRAVVVASADGILAERYATSVNPNTPLLGYSMSKSVVNALVGILVRQQRLSLSSTAPVQQWRSETDARHRITIENLLRMTSGLDLGEERFGFDRSSRIHHLEADMAGAAAAARLVSEPGTEWNYSSGGTMALAGVLRTTLGGAPDAILHFAAKELFEPLGMKNVIMESDLAGTCVCSIYIAASARDWARFGTLYLSDGVIGGRRIFPEDWVRQSAQATLDSDYGAGFWTNRSEHQRARGRIARGIPADAFFAFGSLGQMLLIVPSYGLVIARLGDNIDEGPELPRLASLVKDILSASRPE